jgi:hypothetical protein
MVASSSTGASPNELSVPTLDRNSLMFLALKLRLCCLFTSVSSLMGSMDGSPRFEACAVSKWSALKVPAP